jgi:hypothetical protein
MSVMMLMGYMRLQGNGLEIAQATEEDNGIYACYLDNFVQPVVSYKFVFTVEGNTVTLLYLIQTVTVFCNIVLAVCLKN